MECKEVQILIAAVLFTLASPATALIEFNDGGVHSIESETYDDVWVDYLKPGVGTTLDILEGASVPDPYRVKCWEDSIAHILGGWVSQLDAHNRSEVNMSGGRVATMDVYDSSRVTVSGGYLDMPWGGLSVHDNGQATVSGGSIELLRAYESGRIEVSGGQNISVGAYERSQIAVYDGSIYFLKAFDNSQLLVSGGSIDSLSVYGNCRASVSGGIFERPLVVFEGGTLAIYGSDFAVDGILVGYMEISSIFGGDYNDEPHRRLTGTLLSGEPLDCQFRIGNAGRIVLAPTETAPVADAGADQTVIDVDGDGSEPVTLDGSASSDSDGTIVSWVWTDNLGDPIPDGETVTANLSVGIHVITLTVTDNEGLWSSDTVTVIVEALGIPPEADAGDPQDVIDSDDDGSEPITLDGSASYDTDGYIVLWMWTDSLGEPIPDGEITTADLAVGIHTITLTVADNDGLTDTDTVTITVQPLGDPPVADAGEDIIADANELIVLDAGASYDPDGEIVLYTWTALPEGVVLYRGQNAAFLTRALGRVEEVIKLTVTDNRGGTDEDTVSIFSRALAEIELTPGPQGPEGPQGPQGPPGSQGEQGPPGVTPEEVTQMQEQIAALQQEVADLKDLVENLQQVITELEQTVADNRWLLEQLPQLRKDLEELESRTDE